MLNFVLEGTIVPMSPVNIARPDVERDDPWAGVPYIDLPKRGRVPNIPGETWKGKLRATAGDLVTRNHKLSLTLYNVIYKGGIKGSEKESVEDLRRNAEFRNSNPLLGLFGTAAPHWLGGALSIGPAFPLADDDWAKTSSNGMRTDPFSLDPARLSMLTAEAAEGYLRYKSIAKEISQRDKETEKLKGEVYKLGKPKDGERREDAAEIIAAHRATMKANDARVVELKASPDFTNTIGRPLPDKNGISPDSVLHQRISGTALTEVEFGLFLETLRHMRHDCRIGGHRTIGYGLFRGSWRLSIMEDHEDDHVDAGSVSIEPNAFKLESSHPAVERCLEAWNLHGGGVAGLARYLKEDA